MTDLYVDTSALLKRVFIEDESDYVREVLRARSAAGDLIVSSELAWIEVSRAVLRAGERDAAGPVSAACAGIARQPLDSVVMNRARTVGPANLRSPDAIHLSAAISLGVAEMLTFDQRLAAALKAVGVRAIP